MFGQFATSSIDPGDAATIIGNMTSSNNLKQSQQPTIISNHSLGTNGSSVLGNNTHQINQTVRTAVNNT